MTQSPLPVKTLGRTNLPVTQLGYGSMGLRGPRTWGVRIVDDATADRFLNHVLDSGINFIDTAPVYGVAEERIGRFIGSRRNEYFLATKCGTVATQHEDHVEISHDWNREFIERSVHRSLERLRTDQIDLMQFHGGNARTLQDNGLLDLLSSFKSQGLIRFIGVSSKLPELPELIELDAFDTYQIPYSCLSPEHEALMTRASQQGAGIIVRGGIAQDGPDAEIQRPALNEVWERAGLDELLSGSMTRAELILRYTISHPACHTTIIGTCNPEHFQENLAAANAGPLPADLYHEIGRRVRQSA